MMDFSRAGVREVALLEGGEDDAAAVVDGAHLLEAVADGEDLDLVEFAGDLFAVTGDEGDGGALGEELGGGRDLEDLDVQLCREAEDVVGIGLGGGRGGDSGHAWKRG